MASKLPYLAPQEIRDMADAIQNAHHGELDGLSIVYVMNPREQKKGSHVILGKAAKQSPLQRLLHNFDFAIVISAPRWVTLTEPQQKALLDHELCHCGVDDDGKPVMVEHDIEEFSAVVERHGMILPCDAAFAAELKQGKLFPAPATKEE